MVMVADSVDTNDIDIIQNIWIPVSDGIKLAAKVWLPVDAISHPVPAVLEIIPYRKRDDHAIRDHQNHSYLARQGYVGIRVDMRGSGDSEGILLDEYLPREQQDTCDVIEWLADQPWCDGNVGMIGLSWGAIASLQAASHQPPALKAIVPVGASVDRYYDDGCYLAGCYPGETIGWGAVMFGLCSRAPDPEVVGERWRDMWMERLENTPMFLETWLNHQLRDDFWLQGSVCEKYDSIQVPVLVASGWNDCWPNTVLRLMKNLNGSVHGIQGPWGHIYPNFGKPGPAIDFLKQTVRWWDRWLKGIENGVDADPPLRLFMQQSHTPDPSPDDRPGYWITESDWPSPNVVEQNYFPSSSGLNDIPADARQMATIHSPQSTGMASGEYMPMFGTGTPSEAPHDQRVDDAKSVCFDMAPNIESLEILGTPYVHLRLSCDKPQALVAVRICDVAPDGSSTIISYGVLNLALRKGREQIVPIEPGQFYDVTVRLNDAGYALASGHRLRLAISNSYWPMAWPTPDNATLTVELANCRLVLPTRRCDDNQNRISMGEADKTELPPFETLREPISKRAITQEVELGDISYVIEDDGGEVYFKDIDLAYGSRSSQLYCIRDDDPLSAQAEYRYHCQMSRGDWQVQTDSWLQMTCDQDDFILKGRIMAQENGSEFHVREWDIRIPRVVY